MYPEAGVAEIDGNDGLKFENSALAYQAAIDEVSIVVAQRAFVEDDLRAGRLVEVFDLRASTGNASYLAYPAQEHASAKIRAFEGWIVGEGRAVGRGRSLGRTYALGGLQPAFDLLDVGRIAVAQEALARG